MVRDWLLLAFSGLILLPNTPLYAQRNTARIDLITATIDGIAFCNSDLDVITNHFGRPSAVKDNKLIEHIIGPQIYYHERGLSFWFTPKGAAGYVISIHLVQEWDSEFMEHFMPYRGAITRSPNANMKVDDVLSSFANHSPVLKRADERAAEVRSLGVPNITVPNEDVITIELETHSVNFLHEGTTKFLERLSIACD